MRQSKLPVFYEDPTSARTEMKVELPLLVSGVHEDERSRRLLTETEKKERRKAARL